MSLVSLYTSAIDSFVDKVNSIGPDQWNQPTPCEEWNVRQLVNHIVYEQLWSAPMFAGETIADVGDRFEGDLLGSDPTQAADDAARTAREAVTDDGALGRMVHLSFGDTPGEEYLSQLLADHVIHGWDLAVAIGADRTLNPACVDYLKGWYAEREDLYRGGGAVGPRPSIPAGASDADTLLAGFGRDPDRQL